MKAQKTRDQNTLTITLLEDSLDISNAKAIKNRVFSQIPFTNYNQIDVNFSNITRIDCYGLNELIYLQEQSKKNNTQLNLINVNNKYVQKFFSLLRKSENFPFEIQ